MMDADSPFADPADPLRDEMARHEKTDAAADEVHVGPDVTDAQLDQVDAMHDAEDAAAEDANADIDAALERLSALEVPGDDQVVTECKCAKCGTKGSWTGKLTDEMIERTFVRGLGPDGIPNCIYCGTPMEIVPFLQPENPVAAAARMLEAERAGDAARPQYQPSIPGILPAFDWRTAQLTTESLEANVASAERVWESSKKETAAAKVEFDEAVESLREHIQVTHRIRIEAEFQAKRPADEPAPEGQVDPQACAFERLTGRPCSVCRNPITGIRQADNTVPGHIAAAAVVMQANDQLEASGLRAVLAELGGVELLEETVRGWSAVERAQVLAHLETPGVVERPAILGTPHEAADPSGKKQACRICGAPMPFLPPDEGIDGRDTWPIGQKVGTDCAGEPAADQEPARATSRRHKKPSDAAKAKQSASRATSAPASATTDKKRMAKATKTKPASRKGAK